MEETNNNRGFVGVRVLSNKKTNKHNKRRCYEIRFKNNKMHVPCLLDVVASEVHPASPRICTLPEQRFFRHGDRCKPSAHEKKKKKKNVYFFLLRRTII